MREPAGVKLAEPRDQTYSTIVLQALAVIWAVPVVPAALVLLWVADTWLGRMAGVAALLTGILPWIAITAWIRRASRWTRAVPVVIGLIAVLLTLLRTQVQTTRPGPAGGMVTNQFTRQPTLWLRLAPTNLVPEVDQLAFSYTVMALLDPVFTLDQAADLKRMTTALYREQEQEPGFAKLGSVLPESYAALFGLSHDSGHSYLYIPRHLDRTKPAGLLVFFHGSGGNFKGYLWVLAALADRLGVILVAPTSGFGLWHPWQTEAAVKSALIAANRAASVDPQQVHLIGLSNGGRAVSQLGAAQGTRFKSLTFISPVFDPRALESDSAAHLAASRSVLVVTGALDDRTPLDYVEQNARELTRAGALVELKAIADGDHFLMFSHRGQLVEIIAEWFAR
jgi:pimeloyl-ACP methyl ester carboxylesterase